MRLQRSAMMALAPADGPEHSGHLQAPANDGFAARLDHTGTGIEFLGAELSVAHTLSVVPEVIGLIVQQTAQFSVRSGKSAHALDELLDLSSIQLFLQSRCPARALALIGWKDLAGKFPQMLPRMIEVHDLNGTWKMLVGDIPPAWRTVIQNDSFAGVTLTPIPGFPIKTPSEFLSGFNGSGIGRARVAISMAPGSKRPSLCKLPNTTWSRRSISWATSF